MKPILIIAIAAIILIAVTAVYVASPGSLKDVNETLRAAMNKTSTLSEYVITYNITNFLDTNNESLNMTGLFSIAHKGGAQKMSTTFQVEGIPITMDVYNVTEGMFNCQQTFTGVVCERINGTQAKSPISEAEWLLKLSADGFATVRADSAKPAVRACDAVSFDYDPAKMLANASFSEDIAEEIEEMSAYICFDRETGLPLIFEQTIRVAAETTATSFTRMTVTKIELSAPEIHLPEGAVIS